ncbi:hypothetical protein BaRGS_00039652, partial [Batillaria attramentaria]
IPAGGSGCADDGSGNTQDECVNGAVCQNTMCKHDYGQPCSDNCRRETQCDAGHCRRNPGQPCDPDNSDECIQASVCQGVQGGDNFCKLKSGQLCNSFPSHCVTNADCPGSGFSRMCTCGNNYYDNNGLCLERLAYGVACSSNDMCQSSFRCADSGDGGDRCLCPQNKFRDNMQCKDRSTLAVTITTNGGYQARQVRIQWTKPVTSGQVYYVASLGSQTKPNSTDQTAIFTNLIPGTQYNANVEASIRKEDYGTDSVSYTSTKPVKTKPAIPGELLQNTYQGVNSTQHAGRDVTIQFGKSVGKVDSYTVNVTQEGTGSPIPGAVSVTPTAVNATFTNLIPDASYDVIMIANSNGITSDPQTDTFRVQAEPAGEVSQLTVQDTGSQWIRVTWQKPGTPNGQIKGYTVRVNRESTPSDCVTGVSITCADCTYNETRLRPNTSDCDQDLTVITKTLAELADESHVLDVNITGLSPNVTYDMHVIAFNHKGSGMKTDRQAETKQEDYDTRQYTITGLMNYWKYQVTVFAFTTLGSSPQPTVTQARTLDSQPGQLETFNVSQPTNSAQHLNLTVACPEERQRNGPISAIGYNSTVVNTGEAGPSGSDNTDCSRSFVIKASGFVAETKYQINVFAITRYYHGEISTDTVTLQARAPSLNRRPSGSVKIIEESGTDAATQTSVTVNLCTCLVDDDQGEIISACLIVCRKSDTEDCKPEPSTSDNQKCAYLPSWKMFQNSNTGRYRPTPDDWHKSSLFRDAGRRRRSAPHRDRRATTEVKQYTIGNDTNCGDADASVYCDGPLKPDSEYVIIPVACTSGGCAEYDQPSVIRTKGPDKARVEVLHRNSNLHFLSEYQELLDSRTGHFTTDVGKLEINMMKNRYPAILPYDHTRVKLFTRGHQNQDYINASYISTTVDRYWPTQMDSPSQYGEVTITMTSHSVLPSHTVRKITARMIGEEKQEVTQFELTGWRGHKCTLALEDVADMVQTVGDVTRSCTGPITVHCSDGTTRTASFIALDMLNRFVEEHELSAEVNVFRVLYNMMKCRPHLIQSEDQYIFIHDVLSVIISRKMQDGRGKGKVYQNLGYTDNVYDSTDMYSTIQDTNPYEKLTPQGKATSSL